MTFNEYIKFLEGKGIYLLEYQKILLEKMIEEKHGFSVLIGVPVRHCGFSMARTLKSKILQTRVVLKTMFDGCTSEATVLWRDTYGDRI